VIPKYLKRPKYVIFASLLVLALGTVLLLPRKSAWVPEADCGKTTLVMSENQVAKGAKVYWAITGPVDKYVITVDAEQLSIDPNQKISAGRGSLDFAVLTDLKGCRTVGKIDGVLPSGEHVLRLFRIDNSAVTELASRGFRVQ
jgi:hypothetical protein